VGRGHERRRLLVPGEHELDARVAQGLDDVEILLAGHAEDVLDAFVLQRCHQQVGSFGHGLVTPKPLAAARRLTACAKSGASRRGAGC
jgi:hypothetical protein